MKKSPAPTPDVYRNSLQPLTFEQAVDKLIAAKPPQPAPPAKKPVKKAKKPNE